MRTIRKERPVPMFRASGLWATVQLSQLRFRLFEPRPPGRGKVPAGAVDVEVQHRHRRLACVLPRAYCATGSSA